MCSRIRRISMMTIRAKIRGRRLELDAPAEWPDGTEVEIFPLQRGGCKDADAMSPEEIASTLATMDQVRSFDMTDTERAAWEAERNARKERDKAQFADHAEALRRAWE